MLKIKKVEQRGSRSETKVLGKEIECLYIAMACMCIINYDYYSRYLVHISIEKRYVYVSPNTTKSLV